MLQTRLFQIQYFANDNKQGCLQTVKEHFFHITYDNQM